MPTPFEVYALALYDHAPFRRDCLDLQDRFDADVNVLLLIFWFATMRAISLQPETFIVLRGAVSELRENLILPLRRFRQATKTLVYGFADADTTDAYEHLKCAEILLERVELRRLEVVAQSLVAEEFPQADRMDCAAKSLRNYLSGLPLYVAAPDALAVAGIVRSGSRAL